MISPAYRQRAARALFGSSRSELVPAVLWLGWTNSEGTELSTTRVRLPNTDATFGPSGDGVTNVAPIDGGSADAAWVVGGVALFTAATGGTRVISARLTSARQVAEDEPLAIDAGGLRLQVA